MKRLYIILINIWIFFITIPTKIMATAIETKPYEHPKINTDAQGMRPIGLKGILNLCRGILMPIIVLIGIIIYLKKSESTRKKKFMVSLVSIIVTIILYFGLYYLIIKI